MQLIALLTPITSLQWLTTWTTHTIMLSMAQKAKEWVVTRFLLLVTMHTSSSLLHRPIFVVLAQASTLLRITV